MLRITQAWFISIIRNLIGFVISFIFWLYPIKSIEYFSIYAFLGPAAAPQPRQEAPASQPPRIFCVCVVYCWFTFGTSLVYVYFLLLGPGSALATLDVTIWKHSITWPIYDGVMGSCTRVSQPPRRQGIGSWVHWFIDSLADWCISPLARWSTGWLFVWLVTK